MSMSDLLLRDQARRSRADPPHESICPAPHCVGAWSSGRLAGAIQDADDGADVHVEGDAHVGVAGPGHVGGIRAPGEQGGSAEHMPQAVPSPLSAASLVAPSGGRVGALLPVLGEDRPPRLALCLRRVDRDPAVQLDDLAAWITDRAAGIPGHPGRPRRAGRPDPAKRAPRRLAGGELCYFCVDLGPRGRHAHHGTLLSSCVVAGERTDNLGTAGLPR